MKSNKPRCSVCHLISGDLWAGAEVMAHHLLSALADTNTVVVSAIVFNNGRLATELKNAGIDVMVIEESRYSFPILIYKVYLVLRTKKINILHSHRRKENMLALLVTFLLRGVKLIVTLHGMPEFFHKRLTLSSIITKLHFFLLSHCFNRTVVVSNEIRNTLIDTKRFSQQKTVAIHNGIPLPPAGNVKNKIPGQTFVIGTAGRLVPVKDFGLFIAVAELLRKHSEIRFLLAGDGPLYSELQRKVDTLRLENFTFTGHIDDMSTFYAQVDLFMNTSLHEGIPMTILEAMSRGIPIVAPLVGGIPEIINDGVDGFLVKGRDPHLYAEKCTILSSIPNTYQIMSEAAQKKIQGNFSVSAMTQRYSQIYLETLQSYDN